MKTTDFDYLLPGELIAQYPLSERDQSRLLTLDRHTGETSHQHFRDLPDLLRPGDRLVLNNTRVIPARLWCVKQSGGKVEFLCTERVDSTRWKAMAKPRKRLRPEMVLYVEKAPETGIRVDQLSEDGGVIISSLEAGPTLDEILNRWGDIPLPHYIKRTPEHIDNERYQTVYAQEPGAIAAPTAGLHFTSALLDRLKGAGISFSFVTLNVGIGTFRPVQVEDPHDHPMHEESFTLTAETAAEINTTKRQGGRIFAVGTTAVRVLEHCAAENGVLEAKTGTTRLLILPGYTFRIIDGLITNFHLPKSTLLMLVCAFASREWTLRAYAEAVSEKYRFFSYGDAMLIW
jgi:S-adenosylmethionine:tRNA ribosyltransferase-isomerase